MNVSDVPRAKCGRFADPPQLTGIPPTPVQIQAAHKAFAAQQAGIDAPPVVHTPAQIDCAKSQLAAAKAALEDRQREKLQDPRRKSYQTLLELLQLDPNLCVPEGLIQSCVAVTDRNDTLNKFRCTLEEHKATITELSDVIAKAFAPGTAECPLDALRFVSKQLKCNIKCPACNAIRPAHDPSHDCPCESVCCLMAVDSSSTEKDRKCTVKCRPGEMLAHIEECHPGFTPHSILHLSESPSEEFASATYQVPTRHVLQINKETAQNLSKYRWWANRVHVHGQDQSFWYIDTMVVINGVLNCVPMVWGTYRENVTVTHSISDNKGENIVKQSMVPVYLAEYPVWEKKMYELVLPKDCSLHVDIKKMLEYRENAFHAVSDGKFYGMNIQAHVVFGENKKFLLENAI